VRLPDAIDPAGKTIESGDRSKDRVLMKRRRCFVLLVVLIVVVGIVDFFLYLHWRDDKGESRESALFRDDNESTRASGSSVTEKIGRLVEERESERHSLTSSERNQAGGSREEGGRLEESAGSLTGSSSSALTEKPRSESQNTPIQPKLLTHLAAEVHEARPILDSSGELSSGSPGEGNSNGLVGETQVARSGRLVIERSAIALTVEGRKPTGISDRFSVLQKKVYCWIHVINGKGDTITVRWLMNGQEPSYVHLPVGSDSWRTWSYITLKPSMIGPAEVEILSDGELLETMTFEVTE
jgi:hypothetical protein